MTKRKHVNAIFTYSKNVSQFLTDSLTFYNTLSTAPGNTFVEILPAVIIAAQARIAAARTAEGAVGTGTMGLAAARDLAVSLVEADVRNFVALVQTAANNALDVATATTIINECGLVTRKTASKTKPDFTVVNDAVTAGLLDLTFKAATKNIKACYEIQQSTDNVNWTSIKITPDSSTTYVHGMPAGTKLYFRGRITLSERKGGTQGWITPPTAFIFVL